MMSAEPMHTPQDDSIDKGYEMNTNERNEPDGQECFDPRIYCDADEQSIIEALRSILRPETAPACLYERLKLTLDACCGQVTAEHTIIRHTVIRREEIHKNDAYGKTDAKSAEEKQ